MRLMLCAFFSSCFLLLAAGKAWGHQGTLDDQVIDSRQDAGMLGDPQMFARICTKAVGEIAGLDDKVISQPKHFQAKIDALTCLAVVYGVTTAINNADNYKINGGQRICLPNTLSPAAVLTRVGEMEKEQRQQLIDEKADSATVVLSAIATLSHCMP